MAAHPQLPSLRRRRAWLAVALALLGVLVVTLSGAVTPAGALLVAHTETFHYTGGEQTLLVPTGVYRIEVVAIGGHGGEASEAPGGEAREVTGILSVSPGETLYVEVGGNGNGSEGGFNGGGAGGENGGAGGGGASDIRTAPRTVPLSTEDTRLLIAAGGGGGGGHGVEYHGGAGGNAAEAGAADQIACVEGGGAGTGGGGGLAGGGEGGVGEDGQLGLGGAGSNTNEEGGGGGGGGGGYNGGGGGGAGLRLCGGGGGGGGASKVPSLGLQFNSSAQPKVEISWFDPPSVTIATPPNEASYAQGQVVNADYSCLPSEGMVLKSCTGPVASGTPLDTSTPGVHAFTVEAEDVDSGKSSSTVTYTVAQPPVNPPNGPALPGTAFAPRVAKVKGGKALLKLRCRGGRCGGVVKLQVGRKLIGKARFSIAAGKAKTVRLKLNGRGKKLLRRARRHRLKTRLGGRGVEGRTVVLRG